MIATALMLVVLGQSPVAGEVPVTVDETCWFLAPSFAFAGGGLVSGMSGGFSSAQSWSYDFEDFRAGSAWSPGFGTSLGPSFGSSFSSGSSFGAPFGAGYRAGFGFTDGPRFAFGAVPRFGFGFGFAAPRIKIKNKIKLRGW